METVLLLGAGFIVGYFVAVLRFAARAFKQARRTVVIRLDDLTSLPPPPVKKERHLHLVKSDE